MEPPLDRSTGPRRRRLDTVHLQDSTLGRYFLSNVRRAVRPRSNLVNLALDDQIQIGRPLRHGGPALRQIVVPVIVPARDVAASRMVLEPVTHVLGNPCVPGKGLPRPA